MTTRPMNNAERDYIKAMRNIQDEIDEKIAYRADREKAFIVQYAPFKVGDVIEIREGMLTVTRIKFNLDGPDWFIKGKVDNGDMGYHTINLTKKEGK